MSGWPFVIIIIIILFVQNKMHIKLVLVFCLVAFCTGLNQYKWFKKLNVSRVRATF